MTANEPNINGLNEESLRGAKRRNNISKYEIASLSLAMTM
jgi:hypothetical protein